MAQNNQPGAYVKTDSQAGTRIFVGTSTPSYPVPGDLWIDNSQGNNAIQGTQGVQGPMGTTTRIAAITSSNGYTGTSEASIASATIAANAMVAGTTYRVSAWGVRTGTTSSTGIGRLRIGTTTLSGSIAATNTIAGSATASTFYFEGLATILTTGSSGTTLGAMQSTYGTTVLLNQVTSTVAVNTTVSNVVEFTFQAGTTGDTWTFYNVLIEQL